MEVRLYESALVYLVVQRGEEKILQDGIVIDAGVFGLRIETDKDIIKFCSIKDIVWHQPLLLDKPHEEQSGYKTYDIGADGIAVVLGRLGLVGEIDTR